MPVEEGIKSEILSKELIFWFEKFKKLFFFKRKCDFCLIYFVDYGKNNYRKNKIVSETVMS